MNSGLLFMRKPSRLSDVLIGQPSTNDLADSIDLDGKRIDYVLGIPKGDTHNWVDTEIIFLVSDLRQLAILRRASRRTYRSAGGRM